jgi:hypothetical protein
MRYRLLCLGLVTACGLQASVTAPQRPCGDAGTCSAGWQCVNGYCRASSGDATVPSDSSSESQDAATDRNVDDVSRPPDDSAIQDDAPVIQWDVSFQEDVPIVDTCSPLTSQSMCGTSCSCLWCYDTSRCVEGTANGPTQGTCNSYAYQCST